MATKDLDDGHIFRQVPTHMCARLSDEKIEPYVDGSDRWWGIRLHFTRFRRWWWLCSLIITAN